jgi:TolB-like protein/tetratricopeptide (TPR) repeat protein
MFTLLSFPIGIPGNGDLRPQSDNSVGGVKRQCAELQPFLYFTVEYRALRSSFGYNEFPGPPHWRTNQEGAMAESIPGTSPSAAPPAERLDSWKEIASYLKRDVTTVQRWEKFEEMPVHRHLHKRIGSVYAFNSELDAWVQSRKLHLEEEEDKQADTPADAEAERRPTQTWRLRRWLVLAGVAAVAIGVTYILTRSHTVVATGPKIKSLAVLPLRNFSGDPGQQYFVDGLTEELTTDLAKLGNLRVISHSSAMLYADTHKSLPQIAKDLNVDAVLTGTVERSANRVRVHANLVRPVTDEVLWAESYNRDVDDVLRWEGEVSQAIAHEVGIKLTPQVQHRLERKPTPNAEAHEAYLRAYYFFDKGDKEGATKCLQYFQEAIAKGPGYAAAYVGLSRCYELADDFGLFSEREATSKGEAAVKKAVQLDDEFAEAHTEMGNYYLGLWDYSAAEREYKRAVELDPNSAFAHSYYSFLLVDLGQTEQALQEIRRAHELDPLSLDIAENAGFRLLSSRRYDEAIAQFRSVLEMNPNYRRAMWGLARTYELKGMYKEAISECLKIPALPNIEPFGKALFKRRCSLYEKIYATSGGERFNRNWFQSARQEIKDGINRDGDAYSIATLYAETGENEKALDLLERAYARHDSELLQLKVDPRMDSLRSSPRFQELLRRMNFPN